MYNVKVHINVILPGEVQMDINEKLDLLKTNLKKLGSVAVAFSGGVDSTFLLRVAHDVLGDKVLAVTARSSTYPEREYREAVEYVEKLGVKQIVIISEELDIDGFSANPVNRCYYCKKELFTKITNLAKQNNIEYVADGSNVDDLGDYRPGLQAIKELDIKSPLLMAGLTKEDIRYMSKKLGLECFDKPSFACLATRIPYGEVINQRKLSMIDRAEMYLMSMGIKNVRVRFHDGLARIEVERNDIKIFIDMDFIQNVEEEFKKIGFKYVSLDLTGYKTGSMNAGVNGTNEQR
jgi:uncharacterized protein